MTKPEQLEPDELETDIDESDADESDGAMATVEAAVKKVIGKLLDTGALTVSDGDGPARRGSAKAQTEASVEEQVTRALSRAKEEDRRTAREKALQRKIDSLESKQAAAEKPPREFRVVHKFMGWVREGDE